MLPTTPRGFYDVLPSEARWREYLTNAMLKVCSSWSYAPIETPTLERLEVFERGGGSGVGTLKLLDNDGDELVLRPDVTLPIARMVASRLQSVSEPLRFRYAQPVFREVEHLQGQTREFTQVGIEAIGIDGAYADAEVLLVLLEVLAASGLKDYQVNFCTVGVLSALLNKAVSSGAVDEQWRADVLGACHASNQVELEVLCASANLDAQLASAIVKLTTLRGKGDAIAAARNLIEPLGAIDGLEDLACTWAVLDALGATEHAVIDFSVMCSFDYYTGLVFEAYADGCGRAIGSGGRYNAMLQTYGTSAPAAGFACVVELIMQALVAQGVGEQALYDVEQIKVLELTATNATEVFAAARELRERGAIVRLDMPKPDRPKIGGGC
jgi:ATP phosphoribosyltransferase regulatory subunit